MLDALKKGTPDVIKKFVEMDGDTAQEFEIDKVEEFLEEGQASKRIRVSAAEMRRKQGDTDISRAFYAQRKVQWKMAKLRARARDKAARKARKQGKQNIG